MKEREGLYANFIRDFGNRICSITAGKTYSNVIFLCIGTERLIGDAFGPLVGNRLIVLLRNANKLNVIGNLNSNVSICNITEIMQNIRNTYANPFIVAIDSALSNSEQIGNIVVSDGGLTLGSSMNRKSVIVGDMSIRGIVGKNCRNANQNLIILQKASLSMIVDMAEVVATGIYNSINYECNE